MEILEDNIVQHKLNRLDTLPEGYTPNLDSKWSMLEAGLEGNKKTASAWKPMAAAALVLLLGGGILLLQQIKQRQPLPTVAHSTPNIIIRKPLVDKTGIAPIQPTITVAKQTLSKPTITHPIAQPPVAQETVNHIQTPAPAPVTFEQPQEIQQQIAAAPHLKKHQFIEIDFNEVPVTQTQHTESTIAFRPFKFGIGQQNRTYTINEGATDNVFRFQKSF